MCCAAGADFNVVNESRLLSDLQADDLLLEIMDDNVYEGGINEKFMVLTTLQSGSLEGRVSIQPSFAEVAIEDNDPRPGDGYNNCFLSCFCRFFLMHCS